MWYNNITKRKRGKKMRHFLFEDYDTGEEFIVGADTPEEALEEAKITPR